MRLVRLQKDAMIRLEHRDLLSAVTYAIGTLVKFPRKRWVAVQIQVHYRFSEALSPFAMSALQSFRRWSVAPFLCRDVVNVIIDFLHDDKETLLACSLVARDWVHRSQTHLYNRIVLRDQDRLSLFLSTLATIPEYLRRMIRILHVGLDASWHGPMCITRVEIIFLLDLLPRLHELYLQALQLCGVNELLPATYIPRSLGFLFFRNVLGDAHSLACPLEIMGFISLFHHVDAVKVFNTQIPWEMEYPRPSEAEMVASLLCSSPTLPVSISAQELYITCTPLAASLMQLLDIAGVARALKSLDVSCFTHDALRALQSFLKKCPARLNDLGIDFRPDPKVLDTSQVLSWDPPNLNSLKDLRLLFLRVTFDADSPQASHYMWNRMVDFLDYLSTTQLDSLDISLDVAPLSSTTVDRVSRILREIDWMRLDQVLRHYVDLKDGACLQFCDREDQRRDIKHYLDIVFYRLPICKEDGKLRLQWHCMEAAVPKILYQDLVDMMDPISALLGLDQDFRRSDKGGRRFDIVRRTAHRAAHRGHGNGRWWPTSDAHDCLSIPGGINLRNSKILPLDIMYPCAEVNAVRGSRPPSLNQDIINVIIDCLNEDPRPKESTLAACSLVCRDWLEQSQSRLFRKITIRGHDGLRAFISTATTTSERVRRHIRELVIRGPLSITLPQLASIFECLPRLDVVLLKELRLSNAEKKPGGQHAVRSLRSLCFFDIMTASGSAFALSEIVALMSLFHDIHEIKTMSQVWFGAQIYFPRRLPQQVPDIGAEVSNTWASAPLALRCRNVSLNGFPFLDASLLYYLRHALTAPSALRDLSVTIAECTVPASLERLIESATEIELLAVNFSPPASYLVQRDEVTSASWISERFDAGSMVYRWTVDASLLTNLRNLSVTFSPIWGNEADNAARFRQMLACLAHFLDAPVMRVKIQLDLELYIIRTQSTQMLEQLPLTELDDVLQRSWSLKHGILVLGTYNFDAPTARGCLDVISNAVVLYKEGKMGLKWMNYDPTGLQTRMDYKDLRHE
ncbi:hypothetical protein NM688_g6432 [Phlebia brevispora]|uniref:Uncharacterized protein n=1 Tax=Phlebia brevispora TaxID=194682 RepID=A0ACC1SGB8_9APHY|nr:hypothetical protein NM688_g6432 [Phlebia brevispora]